MSTLSVCLIVKNEELVLDRCLTCVKDFADEIIVVDTGSTDSTIDIAYKYTSHVYTTEWIDDFAYARNISFDYATCDYIMWLDADDVVTPENIQKINELKSNMVADMYMCKYNVGFDGNYVTYSFYRERIVKRSNNYKWHGCVHECITPSGNIVYTDICIEHHKIKQADKDRNIAIYENKLKTSTLDARETYYYGRELYYHANYKKCIKVMKTFFAMNGYKENVIDAHIVVSMCYANLKQYDCALYELYKTFDYDLPRANVCCRIADVFATKEKYNIAIYWYTLATKCVENDKKGAFVENDCYGYYPYMQMCVCYYKLGDMVNARLCNDMAGKIRSDDKVYLHNKQYFDKLQNK